MLINDDSVLQSDPMLKFIGAMNGNHEERRLETGVYLISHFGGSCFPGDGYIDRWRLDDPELDRPLSVNEYGVCDHYQQVLDQCPELNNPNRRFVLCVTPVIRSQQPADGGWRWHKWGPYIGKHHPQHEYLHDEEGIEEVYVYHIYEKE